LTLHKIAFSVLGSVLLAALLGGCQSTQLASYDSDAGYEEVDDAKIPIIQANDDEKWCKSGAIPHLMKDYMPIWGEKVFGSGSIQNGTSYSLKRERFGINVYYMEFLGVNAKYKYGFYIARDGNLYISNQSKYENNRNPNPSPKDAYCMFCTDGGFTDYALKAHQYVGAELNKLLKEGKCTDYYEDAVSYYSKTPSKESRYTIRELSYKEN